MQKLPHITKSSALESWLRVVFEEEFFMIVSKNSSMVLMKLGQEI